VERWWHDGSWRWLYRLPLRLAGIYLLGYGLAAIQLVPWAELASFSPRAAGASFDFVFSSSMAGSNWLLFLFPYLYGSLEPGIYAARPLDIVSSVKLWEHSAYVGILPLVLAAHALLGLGRLPRRTTNHGPPPVMIRALVLGRWSLVAGTGFRCASSRCCCCWA
jgi:hypothetical protein